MKKESYDKVGVISVLLNQKLKELAKCQKEKENILKEIAELTRKNEYDQNADIIKEKMKKNEEAFEKVLTDIKKIQERSSSKNSNNKK